MNILEMILNNPARSSSPPESIFEVKTDTGKSLLMCFASFKFRDELEEIINTHPNLASYEVTKEHFTKDELDDFVE